MKFILKTTLRILLLVLLFVIPIGLFISILVLSQRDIPLWNIGIRNVMAASQNLFLPIIFSTYIFATLFAVALVDPMKVKSIFALHIPPLIAGGIILVIVIFTSGIQQKEASIRTGHLTFLRENSFNNTGNSLLYIRSKGPSLYDAYIYEKDYNNLVAATQISIGKQLRIDNNNRRILLEFENNGQKSLYIFPFKSFVHKTTLTQNRFLSFYAKQIRSLQRNIQNEYTRLPVNDARLYGLFMVLSVLMISIPITYALNDQGWGLSGIVSVFLILFLLPLIYRIIFNVIERAGGNPPFLGHYSYLFPSLIIIILGIIVDVIAKVRGRDRLASTKKAA
ncbi:MAG: hypothetical protein JSV25_00210 [Spirochaetota bacterium]|nr:MAG: hypothetical protein JSV25_00210 [Spirochaetota bacterium]